MRIIAFAALALASIAATPALADAAGDRAEAIRVCRAEVSARAGVDPQTIRLSNVRAHGRSIRVDLGVWTNGTLTNVRCDTALSAAGLEIASINPPLSAQAASAQ